MGRLRLERARYEVQLAEHRYKAVDPDNRVVARTLEREWNEKLGELEALESEHQQVLRREKVELTSQDRARLLELAKDLSYVWHTRSTTRAHATGGLPQASVEPLPACGVEAYESRRRRRVAARAGLPPSRDSRAAATCLATLLQQARAGALSTQLGMGQGAAQTAGTPTKTALERSREFSPEASGGGFDSRRLHWM